MIQHTDISSYHLDEIQRWPSLPDPHLPRPQPSTVRSLKFYHATPPRISRSPPRIFAPFPTTPSIFTTTSNPFLATPSTSCHALRPSTELHSPSESSHYAVDNDGMAACACGRVFDGRAKTANANLKRHIREMTPGVNAHYAVNDDETVTCACGKTFTGATKNANANLKRHIQTYNNGEVFACPNAGRGCSYVAQRKDNVTAHYHRACRHGGNVGWDEGLVDG